MKKTPFDNKDLYMTLLEYRNTLLSATLPSPAQLLFGRKLNGFLPVKETLLQTKGYVVKTYNENKNKRNHYYKSHAKDLPILQVNDNVAMWNERTRTWKPGIITRIDTQRPRSYLVEHLKNGRIYIRNRRFLKKCNTENFKDRIMDELMEEALQDVTPKSETENVNKERSRRSLTQQGEKCIMKENKGTEMMAPERQYQTRSARVIEKPYYLNDYILFR